jgi:hypothetical protein
MPFSRLNNLQIDDPPIRLEQSNSKNFVVLTGFRYETPDHKTRILVHQHDRTDLASIPFFLRWFVQTYGQHTKAAIVHDSLWRAPNDPTRPLGQRELRHTTAWAPAEDYISKTEANRIFRLAMADSVHPTGLSRRWIMWSAVTLDSRRTKLPSGVFLYAFLVLHLLLDVLLGLALLGVQIGWSPFGSTPVLDHWKAFGVPLAWAPVAYLLLGVVLWLPQSGAGMIASFTLAIVFLPTLAVVAALIVLALVALLTAGIAALARTVGWYQPLKVSPAVQHGSPSLPKVKGAAHRVASLLFALPNRDIPPSEVSAPVNKDQEPPEPSKAEAVAASLR